MFFKSCKPLLELSCLPLKQIKKKKNTPVMLTFYVHLCTFCHLCGSECQNPDEAAHVLYNQSTSSWKELESCRLQSSK